MSATNHDGFNLEAFFSLPDLGTRIVQVAAKRDLFTQGAAADALFYVRSGRAKLSVLSHAGREATLMLLTPGDFAGEDSLLAAVGLRSTSATAITACTVLRIDRDKMIRIMHQEPAVVELFLQLQLNRSIRTQADLVELLFHSSEERLAKILFTMAGPEAGEQFGTLIPQVTQDALAEMVGTTRARVNVFMNRFRASGHIEYGRRIRVHRSLTTVFLHPDLRGERPDGSNLLSI